MSTLTLAETLFVEMIDGNPALNDETAKHLAETAVRYADIFNVADSRQTDNWLAGAIQRQQEARAKNKVGCRACFGSGGKANAPCRKCGGTGKVDAS